MPRLREKKSHPPRSEPFKETRQKRSSEMAEDYTEMIADLIQLKGFARTCDLAKEMGLSHVTVIRTLKRLERDGYLITQRYQPIELTTKGKELAQASKKRHQVLTSFFKQLGIPQHIVESDVEGIEHYISEITLDAIEKHLLFLQSHS